MVKKTIFVIIFLVNSILTYAQRSYEVKSEDSFVIAETYIGYDEGVDSVVVKNKERKLKIFGSVPLFDLADENGFNSYVDPFFWVRGIKKITKNIYMLIGIGGDTSFETELNLIFIKKNKLLKYYIAKSNDKLLRDVTFEYLPKTKEVIIPILKQDTPKEYIYDIDIQHNKLDSIKSFSTEKKDLYHRYRLKVSP